MCPINISKGRTDVYCSPKEFVLDYEGLPTLFIKYKENIIIKFLLFLGL